MKMCSNNINDENFLTTFLFYYYHDIVIVCVFFVEYNFPSDACLFYFKIPPHITYKSVYFVTKRFIQFDTTTNKYNMLTELNCW